MRSVPCDLCGSLQATPVCIQRDPLASGGTPVFRVVECQGCGLLYLNPRPEGPELTAYYPDKYYDCLASETDRAQPGRGAGRDFHHAVRRALLQVVYGYPRAVSRHCSAPTRAARFEADC